MQRLALSSCVLALLACEPSTGGITEADTVGEAGSSDTEVGSGTDDPCVVGSLDCTCTPGGGCDPGLECVADMCTSPTSSTSDSDSTDTATETDASTETGSCTELGCACEDVDGACDVGLICVAGVCEMINACGNGMLDADEQCDDGNPISADGCDADCTVTEVLALTAGERHTCALIEGGTVRCWGEGFFGALGYGSVDNIGDNETPATAGDVPLPPGVVAIDAGEAYTCATYADHTLRCWGQNYYGQLGYGNTMPVALLGDDEPLDALAPVLVGGEELVAVAAGGRHVCAQLIDGKVRCWGGNAFGQLGLANLIVIGDDEEPAVAPMMLLGAISQSVYAGDNHTCAITSDGYVRCWGRSNKGQLGYGANVSIGDNESPADAGDLILVPASLPVDTKPSSMALGFEHSCVLFETGDVTCWGENGAGELATGDNMDWGEAANETPAMLAPIDLGAPALAIAAGHSHTCALLGDGNLRCWGKNMKGQLGLANTTDVGVNQSPADAGAPTVGGTVTAVVAGGDHTCALLDDYRVVCWGDNAKGQLGYGHIQTIGDNETPSNAGAVELF